MTAPRHWMLVGDELCIVWGDADESYIPLARLRRACPCATCAGERDLLGRVHRPAPTPLGPNAFVLRSLEPIGGYALQPIWFDGHVTGLYTWELLRRLGTTG